MITAQIARWTSVTFFSCVGKNLDIKYYHLYRPAENLKFKCEYCIQKCKDQKINLAWSDFHRGLRAQLFIKKTADCTSLICGLGFTCLSHDGLIGYIHYIKLQSPLSFAPLTKYYDLENTCLLPVRSYHKTHFLREASSLLHTQIYRATLSIEMHCGRWRAQNIQRNDIFFFFYHQFL